MTINNWKKCKLGDVCDLIGGFAFKSKSFGAFANKVIKIANIQPPYVDDKLEGVDLSNYNVEKLKKYLINYNDFCLAMTGATIGKLGRYKSKLSAYLNQRVLTFRPSTDVDKDFLFHYLSLDFFQRFINNHIDSETAQPNISATSIGQFELLLPPLEEQKRIAEILGSLDDKIELLQKQNKTLEDMAKALFKSWFVDFDVVRAKQKGLPKADIMREYHLTDDLYDLFPSSFADSPLGPIPSGWETSNLDSLCIRCQSGGTPSTKHAEYWENAVIDWFSTKELQDSFLLNSEKTISEEGLNNSSAKLFPKGTIIMAIYASPTVGRLGILTQEATFNQAAVGFIPKEDKISREYLFLMLKHRRDDLNNLANGAAQQNLSVGVVKAFNILIPNAALNTVYKRIVSPLFNKMEFNVKQIQTLTELRDTLLPRLISGKIRV